MIELGVWVHHSRGRNIIKIFPNDFSPVVFPIASMAMSTAESMEKFRPIRHVAAELQTVPIDAVSLLPTFTASTCWLCSQQRQCSHRIVSSNKALAIWPRGLMWLMGRQRISAAKTLRSPLDAIHLRPRPAIQYIPQAKQE